MRKRSIILAGFGVLALAGLLWLLSPGDPVYEGRRLSYWLQVYDRKAYQPIDEPRHKKAQEALQAAGTNAIPVLLRMLRAKDSPLKLKIIALVQKQHVINIRFTTADTLNYEAFGAFYDLGTNGLSAFPAVARVFEENITPYSANCAANILVRAGPEAREGVPILMSVATRTNADSFRRVRSMEIVARIHGKPEVAVPALIGRLHDPDAGIVQAAVYALGEYGKDAQAAIPELVTLSRDPALQSANVTRAAIVKIDPENANTLSGGNPAAK